LVDACWWVDVQPGEDVAQRFGDLGALAEDADRSGERADGNAALFAA